MRRSTLGICLLVLSLTLACYISFEPRPSLEFEPAQLPAAQVGVPYEAKVTVSMNVTPVYSMAIVEGVLPNGLSFIYDQYESFATIRGTPTQAGTFTFIITAGCLGTNVSGQTGEVKYTLEVQ